MLIGLGRLGLTTLTVALGLGVVLICFSWFNQARREGVIRAWSQIMLRCLGLTRGPASTTAPNHANKGRLVVSNHISFIDILAINAHQPASFVSKDEVRRWPLVGPLVARAGTIFIERGSRRAAHATQEHIARALAGGQRVAIFPEGTTSQGIGLLPFHAALFQAAIDAKANVECWRIIYRDDAGAISAAPAYVGELSLAQSIWNTVTTPKLTVELVFCGELDANGTDRRHLAHAAHTRIAHMGPAR